MKTSFPILIGISFFLFVVGCGNGSSNESAMPAIGLGKQKSLSASESNSSYAQSQSSANESHTGDNEFQLLTENNGAQQRKLISTAELHLRVENLNKTTKSIHDAIDKTGGYTAHEEFTRDTYSQQISASFRVPADKFNEAVASIASSAPIVESKNIKTDDVTADFIDISARMAAKKDVENRYRELLKQAKSTAEILEIEDKIGLVRSEIESAQGRLKYLSNQVQYSTIDVVWYEPSTIAMPEDSFGSRILNGLAWGWNAVLTVLVIIVSIWPFLVFAVSVIILLPRLIRFFKRKKKLD